jgi:hypothetical protein
VREGRVTEVVGDGRETGTEEKGEETVRKVGGRGGERGEEEQERTVWSHVR